MTRAILSLIILFLFQTCFVFAQDKNKLDKDVVNYKKKIDEEKKIISAQKNVLSKNDFEIKVRELETNVKEINLTISKKNKDLAEFKLKVEREFFDQLNKVVETYSLNNWII